MAANSSRLWKSLITVLAVAAMAILVVSTHHGAGVGGDATIYMTSAANLAAGKGIGLYGPQSEFRLLPYFPPFFSLVLTPFAALGLPLAETARWLNILLFEALVWLVGWQTYQASAGSPAQTRGLLALAAAGAVGFSPVLAPVYSWAMSEPLAIFLGMAGLVLTLQAARQADRYGLLVLAGFLTGLGLLTRYANAAFLAAGAAILLLYLPAVFKKKIVNAAVYAAAALLPIMIWIGYDLSHTATVSSRRVESSAGMLQRLIDFLPALKDVFLFWWIPESWVETPRYPAAINTLLAAAVLLVICGWVIGLVLAMRRNQNREKADLVRLATALGLFTLFYTLLVAFVYVTTYPPITIGSRMLSPVHVAVIWLVVLLAGLTLQQFPLTRLKQAFILILIVLIGLYGFRTARIVRQNAMLGLGYNSVAWQNSETAAAAAALPAEQLIVTNEEMALLYLTGRASYPLAEIYFDRPLDQFVAYGQGELDNDQAQRLFHDGEAVLVLFDTIDDQFGQMYGERTSERLSTLTQGLERVYRGEDGGIFRFREQ